MFGLKESDLECLEEVLRRYPEVEGAIMYGSRAMGNYKPGSDVDIALVGKVSWETASDISAELNERLPLPYKFDIIAYETITYQPLKDHVDQHGKSFYQR